MPKQRAEAIFVGKNIPTLPLIVQRVSALMDDPSSGTREIGVVLAKDAPLAARVLRIANSAYYGRSERCVSTEQASAFLGMETLRNVVTQAAVIEQFQHLEATGFDLDALWRHSILAAQACSLMSRKSSRDELTSQESYAWGLLHDIGKVVMLDALGTEYIDVLHKAELEGVAPYVAEQHELGYDHADVGAIVAKSWALPEALAMAIEFHHRPEQAPAHKVATSLVSAVDRLVGCIVAGDLLSAATTIDTPTAELLGLSLQDVAEITGYFVEQHMLVRL